MAECLAVALTRDQLVPPLRAYVDTIRRFKMREYVETCEEWETSQPRGTSYFKKYRASSVTQASRFQFSPYPAKKQLTCFHCGKPGHMAKDCRSRMSAENVTTPSVTEKLNTVVNTLLLAISKDTRVHSARVNIREI